MVSEMRVRLPFIGFGKRCFDFLRLAHHSFIRTAGRFLRAFQIVMKAFDSGCREELFFPIFNIMQNPEKRSQQSREARQGWLSFRQALANKFFDTYTQCLEEFKNNTFMCLRRIEPPRSRFATLKAIGCLTQNSTFTRPRLTLTSPVRITLRLQISWRIMTWTPYSCFMSGFMLLRLMRAKSASTTTVVWFELEMQLSSKLAMIGCRQM